jgi:hypothetical protein
MHTFLIRYLIALSNIIGLKAKKEGLVFLAIATLAHLEYQHNRVRGFQIDQVLECQANLRNLVHTVVLRETDMPYRMALDLVARIHTLWFLLTAELTQLLSISSCYHLPQHSVFD